MRKSMIVKFALLAVLAGMTSVARAESTGTVGGGGGNTVNGAVIESYLVDPHTLQGYGDVATQLQILSVKNPDLFVVINEGLKHATWYSIPASMKELSQSTTGIPFASDQAVIQIFPTREVWLDSDIFKTLNSDHERATLIVHEALLAGLNSFIGKEKPLYLGFPTWGTYYEDFFVFKLYEKMPDIKAVVRPTVALVMSESLQTLQPSEILEDLKGFGWLVKKDGSLICVNGYHAKSATWAESLSKKQQTSCTAMSKPPF